MVASQSATACLADRFDRKVLAQRIADQRGLSERDVDRILDKEVNSKYDKAGRGESSFKSISAFEAYDFIQRITGSGEMGQDTDRAKIGHYLQATFFPSGLWLSETPRFKVKVLECHDGDTCSIEYEQEGPCEAAKGKGSVRLTGIDTPEVYSGKGQVNSKFKENVDKVYETLTDGKAISTSLEKSIRKLIEMRIDYTGQLSRIALEGMLKNGGDASALGEALFVGSQIRWTSSDTPAPLCGIFQYFDKYGRFVGGVALDPATSHIGDYMRDQLPRDMATEGKAVYDNYVKGTQKLISELKAADDTEAIEIARLLSPDGEKPTELFSAERSAMMAKLYEDVAAQHPETKGDLQMALIATGLAYDYQKYSNQFAAANAMAGEGAKKGRFGNWGEYTFVTLWKVNAENPRYHPDDCLKPSN